MCFSNCPYECQSGENRGECGLRGDVYPCDADCHEGLEFSMERAMEEWEWRNEGKGEI